LNVTTTTANRIAYGPHAEQFGDLRTPSTSGPHPVLVLFHGGGWAADPTLDRLSPFAEALTEAGLATWNVEYRRLGGKDGGWPQTWSDAALAVDYLRDITDEHSLDLSRVATFGHSAGATSALWVAGRGRVAVGNQLHSTAGQPIRAAIAASGVCDFHRQWSERLTGVFAELFGGSPEEKADAYESISPARLLPLGIPQLLLHGTADSTVPLSFSLEYVALARERGDEATIVEVPGGEHTDTRDVSSPHWPQVRTAILEFLNRTLNCQLS
jgi:acetyl esterase/lipase